RGLTIDLGFAFTTLPSGTEVGFVDVPGHVRFIKNMLAGVGAVEVALLVVAASEGWMPQSEEHLRILELLGVRDALVAITKADTVDDETLEIAQLDVAEHLEGSALEHAPVAVCDSVSGRGIDDVRTALDELLARSPAARDTGRPRLWIDRVFAAKGSGTVVTGTLTGGGVAVDDDVEVGSRRLRARVRAVQTAHRQVERAAPGTRVALNLVGVEHRDLARGDAVVRAGQWTHASTVDAALTPVPGAQLERRARLQAYVGSGEHGVAARLLDDDGTFVRLRFTSPLPLAPGDRLVLRDPGTSRTVAGAVTLDVEPTTKAREAATLLALPLGERLLATHPWLAAADLPRLAGLPDAEAQELARELVERGRAEAIDRWLVANATARSLCDRAAQLVTTHHRDHPLERGIDVAALAASLHLDAPRLRALLATTDDLVVEQGVVRHVSHVADAADSPEARKLLDALDASPFSPPAPADLGASPALVRTLTRDGLLTDVDGVVFSTAALARARALVVDALRDRGTVTVADVRDVLGSTRKYVVPIVTWLDRTGVTRRRGDDRVAGPTSGLGAER
ncbi:MAG TPA: selenocysteine-specific translation elongation factor, partial [Acidimicrobiia bacterium]|nr:selenocysteine-specific translation elongation factor [Acidimicrobiia bacterium]